MNTNKLFALITGASQGFGKELAIELAKRKINLLLVSLPGEGLSELSEELRSIYAIETYYYETDLSISASVYETAHWALNNFRINILINNAGIGGSTPFDKSTTDMLESMIQINIRALTLLTRMLLNELKSHKRSYIMNVASMASFSPMAYKTIYPASKAFVYSFSRGLNQELKETSVTVSVIHPGPMKTNDEVISRIEKQSFIARLGLLSPQKVARISIEGLFNHQFRIVPGLYNKAFWLLMKIIPLNLRLVMVSDIMKREANLSSAKRISNQ